MSHSQKTIDRLREPKPIPLRPSVELFARAMELKLCENNYKRAPETWGVDDVTYLLRRVEEEMAELCYAIEYESPEDVELEAADAANFLLMIVHATGATT